MTYEPRFKLARVDVGHRARFRVHDEMNARDRRFRQQRRELDVHAVVRVDEQLRDAPAQVGVVLVARHEHEARHEAVEAVAPHEQARALMFLQPQDAERDVVELVFVGLEQLVARVVSSTVTSDLPRCPFGRKPARRTMFAHLRRTIGISALDTMYAVDVFDEAALARDLPSGPTSFTPT